MGEIDEVAGTDAAALLRHQLLVRLVVAPIIFGLLVAGIGPAVDLRLLVAVGAVLAAWTAWALRRLRRNGTLPEAFHYIDPVVTVGTLLVAGAAGWVASQMLVVSRLGNHPAAADGRSPGPPIVFMAILGAAGSFAVDLPGEVEVALVIATVVASVNALDVSVALRTDLHRVADELVATTMTYPDTGLPSRAALLRLLEDRLAFDAGVVVFVIQLDRLDEVAAAFGQQAAVTRMRELGDELARDVDSFAAQLDGVTLAISRCLDPDEADPGRRIEEGLAEHTWADKILKLDGHVGWSIAPADATTASELVAQAERAAREAAASGRRQLRTTEDSTRQIERRRMLLRAMDGLADSSELEVQFQPQIDTATGALVAVEALSRWTHPQLGPIRPDEFIRVAEVAGQLSELTLTVLERSLHQLARWDDRGVELSMSVNVSASDFAYLDLATELSRLWSRYDIDPRRLTLEITETEAASPGWTDGPLRRLAEAGVGVAIDDFGTGHSSLLRLREVAATELKIDRAFIAGMSTSDSDATIVRSTLRLGHELGLEMVAEGVEERSTYDWLREQGCHRVQGWLFSPAVPGDRILDLHRRWSIRPLTGR